MLGVTVNLLYTQHHTIGVITRGGSSSGKKVEMAIAFKSPIHSGRRFTGKSVFNL
jgi:hypothetical protein